MTALSLDQAAAERDRALPRWAASALLVLACHALGLLLLAGYRMAHDPGVEAPAILIDLAPPAPPPAPAPPQPKMEPVKPPPEPPPPTPAPPPPPEPAPPVLEPPPPLLEPTPVTLPAPEVPLPPPKPPRAKPVHRIEPPPQAQPVQPAPQAPVAAAPPQPAAPAPAAPPRPAEAAPSAPAAPAADPLSEFERALLAHLEREKRYPRTAQTQRQQGIVYLRFTMDRVGKVLAARIERGSGYADLDNEVMALIRRAEPLPHFPPEMAQPELELVVPVRFFLR